MQANSQTSLLLPKMNIASNKYKKRLNSLKKGVVKRFNKGNSSGWRNRDFEDLSFEIRKETKVLISAATLKRIFGKHKTSETYYPQESTLDAIEKYAGVELQTTFSAKKWIAYSIPVLVILIVLVVILVASNKKQQAISITAELSLSKIEGTTPATAFFSYQVPNSNDSIFISYGDGHPLSNLSSQTKVVSHVYNYPGLFNATIQSRGQVISDTLKVLVPTNGWQALASYYNQGFKERYYPIPLEMARDDDGFHASGKNLTTIGIDTTKIIVLRLDNFKNTLINGDSFALKTRIKNVSYWPAIRCYSGYIKIIGDNGLIIFKLTNEGCSGFGEYRLSEKNGRGTTNDLTGLTVDIKQWNTIKIRNTNKFVELEINDKIAFKESYQQSIGNIMGVSLQFHGSGYVDYFKMYDGNMQSIFNKDF